VPNDPVRERIDHEKSSAREICPLTRMTARIWIWPRNQNSCVWKRCKIVRGTSVPKTSSERLPRAHFLPKSACYTALSDNLAREFRKIIGTLPKRHVLGIRSCYEKRRAGAVNAI